MQIADFWLIVLTYLQFHGTLCVLNERSACTGSRNPGGRSALEREPARPPGLETSELVQCHEGAGLIEPKGAQDKKGEAMSKRRNKEKLKAKLGDLQRLLAPLTANSADLGHLEATRTRFADFLAQAKEAADRQGVHTAAKQEASLQLRTSISECDRLANILRLAVKQHYGVRSEKLAEFGLQPFRGRKTKPVAEPPQPPTPSPAPESPVPADPTHE
jgi:hypothetical protein